MMQGFLVSGERNVEDAQGLFYAKCSNIELSVDVITTMGRTVV